MRRSGRALLNGNAVRLDHSLPLLTDFHRDYAKLLGAKLLLTARLREASRDCNTYILVWWLASSSCTPSAGANMTDLAQSQFANASPTVMSIIASETLEGFGLCTRCI